MGESRSVERPDQVGFSLLEVVVVIAILTVLVGGLTPIVSRQVEKARENSAAEDLRVLGDALEDYFYEHGSFPTQLTDSTFVEGYLGSTEYTEDPWGKAYLYSVKGGVARLASGGSPNNPQKYIRDVSSKLPGRRRTRSRLETIQVQVNRYLEAGGSLSGDWAKTDRAAIGLPDEFDVDGWGKEFRSDGGGATVQSAGPDGKFDTSDDLTF